MLCLQPSYKNLFKKSRLEITYSKFDLESGVHNEYKITIRPKFSKCIARV